MPYGAVAAVVGAVSLFWVISGRPEAGDLAARWGWASHEFLNSRVFSFFVLGECSCLLHDVCRFSEAIGCTA